MKWGGVGPCAGAQRRVRSWGLVRKRRSTGRRTCHQGGPCGEGADGSTRGSAVSRAAASPSSSSRARLLSGRDIPEATRAGRRSPGRLPIGTVPAPRARATSRRASTTVPTTRPTRGGPCPLPWRDRRTATGGGKDRPAGDVGGEDDEDLPHTGITGALPRWSGRDDGHNNRESLGKSRRENSRRKRTMPP